MLVKVIAAELADPRCHVQGRQVAREAEPLEQTSIIYIYIYIHTYIYTHYNTCVYMYVCIYIYIYIYTYIHTTSEPDKSSPPPTSGFPRVEDNSEQHMITKNSLAAYVRGM